MRKEPHMPHPAPETSTTGRSQKVPVALRRGLGLAERLSPELAALLASHLFLVPRRHKRPPREKAYLAGAQRLYGAPGGLHGWQWGDGPPVLLLHGWEGRASQLGAFVAPLVTAGHRVLAFDAPAHGSSPGTQASLFDFARVVEEADRHFGPLHAVVAHSFGAPGAMLAMAAGVRPRAAVFIAPPIALENGTRIFARVLGLSEDVRTRMKARLEARLGRTFAEIEATRVAPRMTAPLLLVHDRRDREVPWEAGARLAGAWPGAILHTTDGLGHHRILRDEQVIARAVRFIAGLAPELPRQAALYRELEGATRS
jgi:pimeloyl-ACP methyl ester carboxylesterase